MILGRAGIVTFRIVMLLGLGVAYLAAIGGIFGLIEARTVALGAFGGAAVGLVAAIGYFACAISQLQRTMAVES